MSSVILFVDGENLRHYIRNVLHNHGHKSDKIDYSKINYQNLFHSVLKGYQIDSSKFYVAKLQLHQDSKDKSLLLINSQRALKAQLEKQGFEFVVSGHVRPQTMKDGIVFKEKGVDVRIAVDIVSLVCDAKVKQVVLCSSDSDLQPAVKEARGRGVEVVYVGFESSPNKGLTYTTNKTILIRDSEILENYSLPKPGKPKKKQQSSHC